MKAYLLFSILILLEGLVDSFQPAIAPWHRYQASHLFVFQEDSESDALNGSLMRQEDSKSQLFQAFTNLDLTDQYDAVLTGLCAKILDNSELKDEALSKALEDPKQLLQEMNTKRIQASPRSLMALMDVRW